MIKRGGSGNLGTRAHARKVMCRRCLLPRKRSQATVFIIIGAVLIVAVVVFFVYRGDIPIPKIGRNEVNANSFLESCVEDKVLETANMIEFQGGYVSNSLVKKFRFDGEDYVNYSYLCYTDDYYLPCVNREPMLISHLNDELTEAVEISVRECYDELISTLEEDYKVKEDYRGFDISFIPSKIRLNIYADISLEQNNETTNQEDFVIWIPSRFYDLALVAQEILSQEARFCYFDNLGYMMIHPETDIKKASAGEAVIYRIKDKKSEEEFRFAVRSCVIPPGV